VGGGGGGGFWGGCGVCVGGGVGGVCGGGGGGGGLFRSALRFLNLFIMGEGDRVQYKKGECRKKNAPPY